MGHEGIVEEWALVEENSQHDIVFGLSKLIVVGAACAFVGICET